MTDEQRIKRRDFLAAVGSGAALATTTGPVAAQSRASSSALSSGADDRSYFVDLLQRMADPLLSRMSHGRLQREWQPELSPTWDGRDPKVAYMEGFGRLI